MLSVRVSELIEQSNQAASAIDAFSAFHRAVGEFGFQRLAIVPIPALKPVAVAASQLKPALGARIPEDWVRHYTANGYHTIDPVLLSALHTPRPLAWDDITARADLTPRQRQIMAESKEAGLHDGLTIPLHGPDGSCLVVMLTRDTQDGPATPPAINALYLLSAQFHLNYGRLTAADSATTQRHHLTDRERECLTWTAQGKSAWAIGVILGVSEHTVQFHLKSAMKKLGTTSKVQAVVIAIREGLILP